MSTDALDEPVVDRPELDQREYKRGATVFYEVGESKRWIQVEDEIIMDLENWR